ncbi:MAG TPA: hypothetical protein VF516_31745 [Kofleriaceae bacterium]
MARQLIRMLAVVVGLAVMVFNPEYGVFSGPSFGAAELRAAVEGTWRLTVRGEDGTSRSVTFRLAQGSEVEGKHAAVHALVRPAAACGRRSLVKPAGACVDVTRMPLEVTLVADGGERRQAEPGEFVVDGSAFHQGELEVRVAELRVRASVTPAGEVQDVSSVGPARRALPSTLVRIAR